MMFKGKRLIKHLKKIVL